MDPPIINETSFLAANPSSYSLTEIWPFPINGNGGVGEPSGGLNLRMSNLSEFGEAALNRDVSVDESTVKEQSGSRGGGSGGGRKPRDANSEDVSSKLISTSCGNHLNDSNGKRMKKIYGSQDENGGSKSEVEGSSGAGNKPAEQSTKPSELPKQDYIHVRARRGQATDSHSLAQRARREKISERMKILQDLVPGCNKIIGKALVLDEIINYIQSLQRQVELAAVNLRMNPIIESFPSKDNDSNGKRTKNIYGSQEENGGSESVEASSETGNKPAEQSTKPSEPPKEDHIHVRARRGQATDTQSLAERVRRENISKRMKILIDLVPGCNKVIGKVLVLDEIINYIQSLQRQVELLSMKLEAANLRMNPSIEGFKKNDGHSVTKSKGLMVRAFRYFLSSMEYLSGCFRCSKSHRIHNI